jgi:hypothetical protein
MSDRKFIVTRAMADGTYQEVGMNYKTLVKSERTAMRVAREWAAEFGRPVRIEGWLGSSFYQWDAKPFLLRYVEP